MKEHMVCLEDLLDVDCLKEKLQRQYIEENTYVAPGKFTKKETLDKLTDIMVAIKAIDPKLSRGDRIFFDVKSILKQCFDQIDALRDRIYFDAYSHPTFKVEETEEENEA